MSKVSHVILNYVWYTKLRSDIKELQAVLEILKREIFLGNLLFDLANTP